MRRSARAVRPGSAGEFRMADWIEGEDYTAFEMLDMLGDALGPYRNAWSAARATCGLEGYTGTAAPFAGDTASHYAGCRGF